MLWFLTNFIVSIVMTITLLVPMLSHANTKDFTSLSLEELMNVTVTGASRFEQKVSQAPSFVNIITADDIKKYGYRTMADIIRSVSGFYVTYDRNYSYIGARGFGFPSDFNTRFLIVVDGHRLNENVFDSTLVGTDFILDIDLIDRVEIIRGPGSALYGSNAFFGVINVITRNSGSINGAEISGSAGSYDTYAGRLTYGKKFGNGFGMLFSASGYRSKGDDRYYKEFDSPSTNFGVARHLDEDRSGSAFAQLSFKGLTLTGAFNKRIKGVPTAPYWTDFNDDNLQTIDKRAYLDLKYAHEFNDKTSLNAHLFYDQYSYKGTYPYSGILNKDDYFGRWWGGDLMVTRTFFDKHKVSIGGEYIENIDQNQRNYDESPYFSYSNNKNNSRQWAAFIQDEFTITNNLILNAGVRYDHYSTFGGTTNPRAALIYNPWEKTTFKFLYGSAFRAPNHHELYYYPVMNTPNPGLGPEKIRTYEVVYEQYLIDSLRLTMAGFYNEVKDVIVSMEGLEAFENKGAIKAQGIEVQVEGNWKNWLKGRLSYTFQDARNKETNRDLPNSPKHMAKLNLIFPLWQDKVFSGLETQYMSNRKTQYGTRAGGFFITNLTLFSQKLLNGLEISASAYNLFDKKYGDPGGFAHIQNTIEQDGRTFRLKMTYAF